MQQTVSPVGAALCLTPRVVNACSFVWGFVFVLLQTGDLSSRLGLPRLKFVLKHAPHEEIFHRGTHSVYDSAEFDRSSRGCRHLFEWLLLTVD